MKKNGRYLSHLHVEAYKSGVFAKLLLGINEDPELSFEVRRNDEAMVYYHKDKILTTGNYLMISITKRVLNLVQT